MDASISPGVCLQLPPDQDWYSYTLGDALRFGLVGIRQSILPSRHLIAGPYVGEFGWELMQWQGYVRSRRRHYGQTHVITYPGRDYLYEGCRVHYHNIPLKCAGHRYGKLEPRASHAIAHAKAKELGLDDYDVFSPDLICTRYHRRFLWRQEFRIFEEPTLAGTVRDVAFHFRALLKSGDHPKNYPRELADELVQRCRDAGLSVLCLGHPDYAYCAAAAEDCRSVETRQTVAAISSARLVAGENSGPMHLANLCGKATVLWAYHQSSIDYSLRWNPFRVPIYVAANDTPRPEPVRVYQEIVRALDDLRKRTNNFAKPAYCLPAQPIVCF